MSPLHARSLAVLSVLALAACGGAGGSDPAAEAAVAAATCGRLEGLPSQSGDLVAYLEAAAIAPSGSNGFQEPEPRDLSAFESAFRQLVSSPGDARAAQALTDLGFSLSGFQDARGTPWLLVEESRLGRGGGTFAVNLAPARDAWIEIPHADSDKGTLTEGSAALVALGARAVLITGTNRCASDEKSPCAGTTGECKGGLRVSDAAHYDRNFFTAAHRALRAAFPDALAINLHGMSPGYGEAAVVSDGTKTGRAGSISRTVRDALNRQLPAAHRAFSCNDRGDDGRHRMLCGTDNVQGRIDNAAPDACSGDDAARASDRFVHIEQSQVLRLDAGGPERLAAALAEVVPCTLGGAGLSCAASPSSAATACR